MPTPQTQRSTYRDRRINVMLQESHDDTPLPPHEPAAVRVRPPSQKSVLYISLATAALCALVMFFLLSRRDSPQAVNHATGQPVQSPPQHLQAQVPAPPVPQSTAPSKPAAAPATAAPAVQTQPAVPVQRVHFRLKRSAHSQTFGAVSLRLLSTNARRGTCSLTVSSPNSRPTQRAVQTNHPLELSLQSGVVSILVNAVNRDSISGYVTQP